MPPGKGLTWGKVKHRNSLEDKKNRGGAKKKKKTPTGSLGLVFPQVKRIERPGLSGGEGGLLLKGTAGV